MVGRPEGPLDPGAGPLQQLAYELRKLRVEAGSPTYREMARLTGSGASTLSQAAGGLRLPSLPTLRAYVEACGGDAEQVGRWELRWREAATGEKAGATDAEGDSVAPYRGLRRFEARDSELFFGRDDLVARLVERLREQRLVAVVGASGSGKSSLLRAGLIPALRSGQDKEVRPAAIRILTPGPHPAAQEATRVALLPPGRDEDGDAVVIVDQFEEVFTLGAGAEERTSFLDRLLTATRPGGRLRVVIAVRADFFGRCAEHPGLAEALRDATLLVAPMGPEALREAIVRPAASAGLIVERSLTARIVREAGKEPGSLPLVSHALLETWRRRRGRALTEEMYQAAGGIHGAIDATAESLYARLSPSQAATARRILLRLVTPGDGAQDTRRPTGRAELEAAEPAPPAGGRAIAPSAAPALDAGAAAGGVQGAPAGRTADDRTGAAPVGTTARGAGTDARGAESVPGAGGATPTDTSTVLELLVQARLLTTDGDTVDLAHEAVISAWPRFRAWVEEDRERLRLHRRLTEAAATWEALDRDPGALYRGSRLAAAQDAFGSEDREGPEGRDGRNGPDGRDGLTGLESAFLDASTAARGHELRTAARATRRLRALTATLSVLLVLAVTAGTVAWRQSRASDAARRAAVAAQQVTLSRQLAAQSASAMSTDTEMGMLLAVQAYRVSPTAEATAGLYRAAAEPLRQRFAAATGPVRNLVFSHDGRTLAWSADDGSVSDADVATGRPKTVLAAASLPTGLATPASVVLAFSGDDRTLVSGYDNAEVRRTDLAAGRTRTVVPGRPADGPYPMYGAQLDADGSTMITYTPDDRDGILAWSTATGQSRTAAAGWRDMEGLSPDGHVLAASGTKGLGLWDTATGRRLTTFGQTTGPVAFSKDGHTVALSGPGDGVGVWHWTAGHAPTPVVTAADTAATVGATGTVALSPDGKLLAAGSTAGAVHLWNTTTGRSQALLNDYTGTITALTFSDDGGTLAAGAADGTVRLFDTGGMAPTVLEPAHRGGPMTTDVAFADQGRLLATSRTDGTLRLWRTGSWQQAAPLDAPGDEGPVRQIRSAASGRSVLTLEGDGTLRLWDTGTRRSRVLERTVRRTVISYAALSADGRTVAAHVVTSDFTTGVWKSVVNVWDTASGKADPVRWTPPGDVQNMVLSPDGRTLAIRDNHGEVNLVAAATGRTLRTLAMPGKGPDAMPIQHPRRYPTMAFSPDGRLFAAGGNDGTTWLWDTGSGRRQTALSASTSPTTAVAFGGDGNTLAVAATDGTLRLWDVPTAQVRSTLNAGPSSLVAVALSPDGGTLAAVAKDGSTLTVAVPASRPATAITAICKAVDRAPTPQETARYLPHQALPAACPSER